MLKRLFDVGFAGVSLLLLAPLLLAVSAWVKLDSPGPVFYRQVRVGRHGREFKIYKFRTMRRDADRTGLQITVGADARITRAGRFLRKYKIDEFPQFINVLTGDMSVVGPRPEVSRYVALYPPATRDRVLSIRPGITDLASIEYLEENELLGRSDQPDQTYVDVVMPAKLVLCERYVRERSMLGDLVIIVRSFQAAFRRR